MKSTNQGSGSNHPADSNNLPPTNTPFTANSTYYYCVMPGNYPSTMRTVMNKRGNWVEVSFRTIIFRKYSMLIL